jgi:hypothetical protein
MLPCIPALLGLHPFSGQCHKFSLFEVLFCVLLLRMTSEFAPPTRVVSVVEDHAEVHPAFLPCDSMRWALKWVAH